MINKFVNFFYDQRSLAKISIALSKGLAGMQSRSINLTHPATWEFSGFSQNGEDGILDVLRKKLITSNSYFIEIGSADGIQNNSSWLAVTEQYNGLMIDGNPSLIERAKRNVMNYCIGVECLHMFVSSENIEDLKSLALHSNPDVFSLDIDGVDYYIAKAIMDGGFRPKIFVVEYNSVFGPTRSMTIRNQDGFVFTKAHPTHLYYGVSVAGWKNFFSHYGYRFVTVDRKGVNAFFVDPTCFDENFLHDIDGKEFEENMYQYKKFKGSYKTQFPLIEDEIFIQI